jgi:hypothetical protein
MAFIEESYASDDLATLRRAYLDPATPVATTLKAWGLSAATFYGMRERLGWPRRSDVVPRRGPAFAPRRRPGRAPIGQRLERMVVRRMELIEEEAASGVAVDPERASRALATLAKTLKSARDLGSTPGGEGRVDEPERPLAELRDELLRHLERIRAERGRCGGREPDGPA